MIRYIVLICFFMFFLNSCDNETVDIPEEVPMNIQDSFFAKVDGIEYMENSATGINSNGLIIITALTNDEQSISLTLDENIIVGTYDFVDFTALAPLGLYVPNINNVAEQFVAHGNFTIISHDVPNKKIKGTFEFTSEPFSPTGTGSFEITEGQFDITYL